MIRRVCAIENGMTRGLVRHQISWIDEQIQNCMRALSSSGPGSRDRGNLYSAILPPKPPSGPRPQDITVAAMYDVLDPRPAIRRKGIQGLCRLAGNGYQSEVWALVKETFEQGGAIRGKETQGRYIDLLAFLVKQGYGYCIFMMSSHLLDEQFKNVHSQIWREFKSILYYSINSACLKSIIEALQKVVQKRPKEVDRIALEVLEELVLRGHAPFKLLFDGAVAAIQTEENACIGLRLSLVLWRENPKLFPSTICKRQPRDIAELRQCCEDVLIHLRKVKQMEH